MDKNSICGVGATAVSSIIGGVSATALQSPLFQGSKTQTLRTDDKEDIGYLSTAVTKILSMYVARLAGHEPSPNRMWLKYESLWSVNQLGHITWGISEPNPNISECPQIARSNLVYVWFAPIDWNPDDSRLCQCPMTHTRSSTSEIGVSTDKPFIISTCFHTKSSPDEVETIPWQSRDTLCETGQPNIMSLTRGSSYRKLSVLKRCASNELSRFPSIPTTY